MVCWTQWTHLDSFGLIWTYLDSQIFGLIWTPGFSDSFELIWTPLIFLLLDSFGPLARVALTFEEILAGTLPQDCPPGCSTPGCSFIARLVNRLITSLLVTRQLPTRVTSQKSQPTGAPPHHSITDHRGIIHPSGQTALN